MKTYIKVILILIACLLLLLSGFFIGRKSVESVIIKVDTTYVELPIIHDTITNIKYVNKIVPIDSLSVAEYLYKSGKLDYLIEDITIDTVSIIKEFISINEYKFNVFDIDTVGKLDAELSVQFNELSTFSYNFTPVSKVITNFVEKKRLVEPFIFAGPFISYNELKNISIGANIGAGLFIKQHYGVGYNYSIDVSREQSHNLNFYYKF